MFHKNPLQYVMSAWRLMEAYCDNLLGDEDLYNRLDKSKFDVMLLDLVYNECGLALAHKLRIPVVGYWAFSFSSGEQEFTTAPAPPSYVPAFMSQHSDKMTFLERCDNLLRKLFGAVFMSYNDWYQTSIIRKHLPSCPATHLLLGELSGVLINSDFVLDYPRPLPPTFLNVGGLQIRPGAEEELPAGLQSWLDGAEKGKLE